MSTDAIIPTAVETEQHGDTVVSYTHPAFAMISRGEVSGESNLFGTNVKDNNFITIEIDTAYVKHSLNRDWYHSKGNILRLKMSKLQWANFISTSNSSGTPCTLTHCKDGNMMQVPQIKGSFNMREQIQTDAERMVTKALEAITENLKLLQQETESKGAISKPKLREISRNLNIACENLPKNMRHSVDSALRDIERIGDEIALNAKAQVEQYAQGLGLTQDQTNQLQIEAKFQDVNQKISDQ